MSDNETKTQKIPADSKKYFFIVLVALLFLIPIGILILRNPNQENMSSESSEKDKLDLVETNDRDTSTEKEDSDHKVEFTVNGSENETADTEEVLEIEEEPETYAELSIKSYDIPDKVIVDEEVEIEFLIQNTGDKTAEDFILEFRPTGDAVECDPEIDELGPGDTTTVDCNFTFEDVDTYDAVAEIDADDDVEEEDEDNNTLEFEIEVEEPDLADLIITEYSFDPVPEKNVPFTVRIGIKNIGTASSGSFNWEWWPTWAIDACSENISELAPNSTKVVTCDYEYQGCSTYATKAVVDVDGEVEELDEDNNEYEESLVVPCF